MKKVIVVLVAIFVCLAVCMGSFACNNAATRPQQGQDPVDKDSSQSADQDPVGDKETYTVFAPDGAPALALAKMMKDNAAVAGHAMDYRIIGAANVAASMINGDADFIIAPTNAGVMQSINTDNYYMLGVTSWGNLYIVTTNDGYEALADNATTADAAAFLEQFAAKSISSIGNNQVPDNSLKYLLGLQNVDCTVADGVDAATIQADLIAGSVDCALLGEPAATATKALLAKNGVTNYRILGSLSAVWQSLTGLAYPQAGIFVKKSVAADQAFIAAFESTLAASIDYFNASAANAEELGNYMQSREDNSLKGAIVKQCYLRTAQSYRSASAAKEDVKRLVGVLVPRLADGNYDGVFYQAQ